jgi:shikimate dehydrogenase
MDTEKHFGITGTPVEQSQSPALFKAAYHGKHTYELLPAATGEEAVQLFREKELSGMNVTMPLKTSLVGLLDILSEEVRAVQAVNTIVLAKDGRLYGANTDVLGVRGALKEAGVILDGTACLVLGAGGAGRAAAYALAKAGAAVTVASRTAARVEGITGRFSVKALSLDEALPLSRTYRVIVNTLPAEAEAVQQLLLNSRQIVLDADYIHKPMRVACRDANAMYIDGLRWLLYQAIPAFYLFTGEKPDAAAMAKIWKP